jgi:hypothetical protein
MTSDSDFESYSPGTHPPVRPALYPVFVIPIRVANVAGVTLVGSAALVMIAELIEALSYRSPGLSQVGLPGTPTGTIQFGPSVNGFADRLAMFTSGGANLTVAILLVVAVAVVVMAARGRESDEELFGRGGSCWRPQPCWPLSSPWRIWACVSRSSAMPPVCSSLRTRPTRSPASSASWPRSCCRREWCCTRSSGFAPRSCPTTSRNGTGMTSALRRLSQPSRAGGGLAAGILATASATVPVVCPPYGS